ncbi:MAG: phage portal protein, partial [Candidatus Binatia bacterium]
YAANGVVFSCMAVRMLVFSAIRFSWQRFEKSRPSELFGNRDLALLEQPWVGGTTQDLLSRIIVDADLSGNSYWTLSTGELVRLRPDWVQIILESRYHRGGIMGWHKIGYLYTEGGPGSGEAVPLLPDEVMHFAPHPDPLASYRGMSWLTPVVRQLTADQLMTRHKHKFFENGASPNLIVKMPMLDIDKFKRFKAEMDLEHKGIDNAYKTLYLGGGADVSVVGSNFEQMTFTALESAGEVRIAAASGVPPILAGMVIGIENASYANFAHARRRFADGTMHPMWMNIAGSFAPLVRTPAGSRLHYDARDVPFLREDAKDAAEITEKHAATMSSLVMAGYTPESVKRAVVSGDLSLLDYDERFISVQLMNKSKGAEPPANNPVKNSANSSANNPDNGKRDLTDVH